MGGLFAKDELFDSLQFNTELLNSFIKYLRNRHFKHDISVTTTYKSILKNNIFGVDLNYESAQITKLSLWIKTANNDDSLIALDDTIKCGNSLIDDPKIDPQGI